MISIVPQKQRLVSGMLIFVCLIVSGAHRLEAQSERIPSGKQLGGFHASPPRGKDDGGSRREDGKTADPQSSILDFPSSILHPPSAVPGRLSDSRPITRSSRQSSNTAGEPRKPQAGVDSPWKTLAALVFVLAVILVGARLWKKHGPGISTSLPTGVLEVLGKRQLDSRQSIHLVRLGTRVLVLGSTAAGLRTLAEVTDPVEVDYLAGLCRQNTPEGNAAGSFRALFSRHSSADTNHQPTESLQQTHQGEFSQAGHSPGDVHEHAGLISEEAHV